MINILFYNFRQVTISIMLKNIKANIRLYNNVSILRMSSLIKISNYTRDNSDKILNSEMQIKNLLFNRTIEFIYIIN